MKTGDSSIQRILKVVQPASSETINANTVEQCEVEAQPQDANAYFDQGNAYHRKGDYDRAVANHTKGIELKPNDAIAHNDRGITYGEAGKYARAIDDFDEAIKLNPNYAEAYNNRGFACHNKGDYDHAIVDYSKSDRTQT